MDVVGTKFSKVFTSWMDSSIRQVRQNETAINNPPAKHGAHGLSPHILRNVSIQALSTKYIATYYFVHLFCAEHKDSFESTKVYATFYRNPTFA